MYRADAPNSGNCYWARLASDSGSIDDIVQNGNVAGPVTVTVGSSDYMLELAGCSDFHKIR